jgi:predicted nuclease with TOPRIM domain
MKLDEKILEAIKQGLPEATVGAFKERMEELEHLANQVEPLKGKLEDKCSEIKNLTFERNNLKGYKNRLEEIERAEYKLILDQTELRIKSEVLEVRTELMDTRVTDHKEMFNVVFRNTTLRNEIHSNSFGGENDYNNNINKSNNETRDVTTKKTEE